MLGRDQAPHAHRSGLGYDHLEVIVDDATRLAYVALVTNESATSAARALLDAAVWFAERGVRIERVLTDNAWAYRYSLRAVCAEHGIVQKFIKPHCPWQNGKVERLNRTLATEWAYRQVFTTNDERAAALAPWLEHYNTERRHTALGGLPPVSRLLPT